MKRFSLILISFLLVSSLASAGYFPDVDEDHENYKAIEYLKENGIIDGYDNGDFGPEDLLTRAQALKILMGGFDIPFDGEYEVLFPDVLADEWYFPYVMGAREAGLAKGYDDGTFRPDNNVNLAESLKILFEAADVDIPDEVYSYVYQDVSNDAWFAEYALYARDNNILMADDYGNVYPDQEMTRAKFAEIVYRTIIVKDDGKPFPLDTDWPLYESDFLPFQMKYPNDWKVVKNTNDVTFFKADELNGQFFPVRTYPNSAYVIVTVDPNEDDVSEDDYFQNLRDIFNGSSFTEFTMDGFPALEVIRSEKVDWYVYLSDGRVLVIYTEYGDGQLSFQLPKFIKAMLGTLEYRKVSGVNYSEILSNIFANILIEGTGQSMLNLLPDAVVIETDTIGVGTGPVDYYYSEGAGYTFKYERASDVILDKREGETSAF